MNGKWIVGCGAAVLALACTVVAGGSGAVGSAHNGKIAFFVSGGGPGIESIMPDGSGRKVLAPMGKCAESGPPACKILGLAWSPDGRRLAFLRGKERFGAGSVSLYLINSDGSRESRLIGVPPPMQGNVDSRSVLSWSPDGAALAIARGGSLYVVSTVGHAVRRLTHGSSDGDPAWSPDGSRIAFTRGSLYTARPDGSRVKRIPGSFGAYSPSWSPDSRSIVFAKAAGIYTFRADGSHLARVAVVSNWADNVAWSPNGTRILYSSTPGTPGAFSGEVWVIRPDGTRPHRVYRQECCIDYSPTAVWSPDGKEIAVSAAGGFSVVRADGTGLRLLADGVIATGSAGLPQMAWQVVR